MEEKEQPQLVEIEFRFAEGEPVIMKKPTEVVSYVKKDFDVWFIDRRHIIKYAKQLKYVIHMINECAVDMSEFPEGIEVNNVNMIYNWIVMYFKITEEELQ